MNLAGPGEVRGILTALNDRGHVVVELDRDNVRGLSDALVMAVEEAIRTRRPLVLIHHDDLGRRHEHRARARRRRQLIVASFGEPPAAARTAPPAAP
jgi:hypothetical protein